MGGEEFSVALPGLILRDAEKIAQNICNALQEIKLPDKNGSYLPPPTISQGIAGFPFQAQTRPELIDIADEALYQAKNSGRCQITVAAEPKNKDESALVIFSILNFPPNKIFTGRNSIKHAEKIDFRTILLPD